MNKYTFEIILKNGESAIKTFEALTLILAQNQLTDHFKHSWLDFTLLIAKSQTGRILFENRKFNASDLDFEQCLDKEQLAKDALALYESSSFKLALLTIVLGAVGLGVVIGLVISR